MFHRSMGFAQGFMLAVALTCQLYSQDAAPAPARPAPQETPTKPTRNNLNTTTSLPSNQGQVWREYDLREYTSRVSTTVRPEQAVIDWVLRETGTEVWFADPLGVLHADRDTLRVYHTPEMQQLISGLVDRLVSSKGDAYSLGVRLVTINNPNWRARAMPLMQSVTVQSPGVDAWLLSRENAAMLLGELRQRADFKEHQSQILAIPNGQSQTVARLKPRNYVRSVHLTDTAVGYQLETSQIQEGYSLQISPLLDVDQKTIDLVIKCQIDQVEQLIPVTVEVPAVSGPRQPVRIEVPQIVSWRLHERFRWQTENVLLLSCGVVATPSDIPSTTRPLPRLMGSSVHRADALLFIECQGSASPALVDTLRSAERRDTVSRGRY